MNTNDKTDVQLTSWDLWGDPPWAPAGGWDNQFDILEGKRLCRDIGESILPGERGLQDVFNLSIRLRERGISSRVAADLIFAINKPPHAFSEILAEAKHAYSVVVAPPGLLSTAAPPADKWPQAQEPDDDDLSWLEGGPPVWPKPLLYDTKQHNAKLAEHFLSERPAKLIVSDGVIFTLDDWKVWRELPEPELAAEIRATDPTLQLDTPRIFGIISAIKLACFTTARPFDWIDKPHDAPGPNNLILLGNGILDCEEGTLLPHSGRYFATGLPAFNYDPAATCPLWEEKLAEWLHPSFHPTLQEFVGYSLTADTRYEVLLAMIGAPRGGKGTIMHVMQSLVGAAHHISRTMNDLADSFGLEGCLDKRLMFIPDAHSTEINKRSTTLERIKCITGNDEISINRKNKTIINAHIPTKIILSANQPPKFLDESGALALRELTMLFEKSFSGREDRELRAKLTRELPGICNWALTGLRRLRENGGKFTIGAEGKAASRELAESQSPALRFANAWLDVTGEADDYVPLAEVYEAYRYWALEIEHLNSREIRGRNDFKSDLIAALRARGVRHGQHRWHASDQPKKGKGKLKRGLFGLKVKRVTPTA